MECSSHRIVCQGFSDPSLSAARSIRECLNPCQKKTPVSRLGRKTGVTHDRDMTCDHDQLGRNESGRQRFLDGREQTGQKHLMPYLRGRFYDGPPISDLDRMGKLSPGAVLATLNYVLPWLEEKQCPACSGRGIVMVAGGKYLKWAFASVSMARRVTDLPIQIWHLGKRELAPEDVERFDGLDVEFVDATSFLNTYRMFNLGGWEAKSYVVANCPFQEVLLLDADAYPVADPEDLFNSPEFEKTGCIMWPDLNVCRKTNLIFPSMGLKHEPNFQEMEVGQLVIDKKRLWPGVRLTVWMNSHSEAFYQMLFGDKDTWQIALRKMGIPFTVGDKPDWHGWGMTHRWKGKPVFNHAMSVKRGSVEKPPREYMELLESYSQLQPA